MIDGFFKHHIDPHWDRLAKPLAKIMTANQVTVLGLTLVLASCAVLFLHRTPALLSICLAASFACDSLDGAVARLRGETSKFGGYMDAIVDRYQELAVFCTIAIYSHVWPAAMVAFAGAMLTSYAKARTAIETPIDNAAWPDLFERQERVIYLCLLLLATSTLPYWGWAEAVILNAGLWLLAVLCHLTAVQRFWRAKAILQSIDKS